jgi:hypothetical protein
MSIDRSGLRIIFTSETSNAALASCLMTFTHITLVREAAAPAATPLSRIAQRLNIDVEHPVNRATLGQPNSER